MPSNYSLAPSRAFRGLRAFWWTELLVQAHEWLAMATSMVVQGVLLIFVWILDPSLLPVSFLGAILFSMFTMGQRVLNEAAYLRIDHKANDLYLASPITPEGYFLGMAFGILTVYLGPVLVIAALSTWVVHYTVGIALLLVALSIGVWLFSASTGYIFSTFFRDNRAIWAYSSLFFNLFGVLFPVFYPLSLFPPVLRPLALVLPPSAAASLLQASIGALSLSLGEVALAAGSLTVEIAGLLLLAILWARRSARES
jgi:hypothetical protein